MKRLFLITILLLPYVISTAQTVDIGQDAQYIKALIERSTYEKNKPDSFGNYSSGRVSWDVKYYNGIITDVIQCFKNQFYIDLRMQVDFCKHYVMKNGKLAYILTQYENVSTDKLKEVYDKLNNVHKYNDLYFEEDFKHYSKLYLDKNGLATIEWRSVDLNQIPSNIKKEIEDKQKAVEDENNQKKLSEEKEELRVKEITLKVYDLSQYDKATFIETFNRLKHSIINVFKTYDNSISYRAIKIPSYFDLNNSAEKKFRFTNIYNAHFKLEDHSRPSQLSNNVLFVGSHDVRQIKNISLVSGNDKSCSLFDDVGFKLQTLQIEGYEVMTEARFDSIRVDYAKGITIFRIKNGNINFIESAPDNDLMNKIKDKLSSYPNGKYRALYEVINVMGDEEIHIQ